MAAVTICSDFGAPQNNVWHRFYCFPIYFPWSYGTRSHDLCFLNVEPNFSHSSFTFIKTCFSSSSLSAIRVVSSAFLRLLIFLSVILISAYDSSCINWEVKLATFASSKKSSVKSVHKRIRSLAWQNLSSSWRQFPLLHQLSTPRWSSRESPPHPMDQVISKFPLGRWLQRLWKRALPSSNLQAPWEKRCGPGRNERPVKGIRQVRGQNSGPSGQRGEGWIRAVTERPFGAGLPGSRRQHCMWFVVKLCQLAVSVRGGILLCQNKRRKVKSHEICYFKNKKALSRHNKAWR